MLSPKEIVGKMLDNDAFSKWLGIEIVDLTEGFCKLQLTVTKDMLNGFGIAHGGITYALADSCVAFAANSYGIQSVSIDTSINHLQSVRVGTKLYAESEKITLTNRTGIFTVNVYTEKAEPVAFFKGTVYRTQKTW